MRIQLDVKVSETDFEKYYRHNMKNNSRTIILFLVVVCIVIGFLGAKLLAKDQQGLNIPVFIILTFMDCAVVYFFFSFYTKKTLQKALSNGICESLSQSYIFYDTYFTTSKGSEAIFYKDIVEVKEMSDLLLLKYTNVYFVLPLHDMSFEERTSIEQLIKNREEA
ncbi:MAG: hypothetical protein RR863_02500 [Erysipelotrichaceae bacterium]